MLTPFSCINLIIFGFVSLSFSGKSLASDYPKVERLLETSRTVIGQDFEYPKGQPKITAVLIELSPGQSTGWHKHEVTLFASILSGELTVDYRGIGRKYFYANDTLVEAIDTAHLGTNTGDVPTKILAVFIGAEGLSNTIAEDNIIGVN